MTITLLHPSRNRPEKSLATVTNWLNKSTGTVDIEVILSIDSTDTYVQQYINNYNVLSSDTYWAKMQLEMHHNDSVVEATNWAAKSSKGDILIYLSDDFDCPQAWDVLVLNEFDNGELPRLVKVDDCLQEFHVPVLTIPIMNRSIYEKLGYFWHPEYKSMFVDEDLYWTCANNGWIRLAPYLQFPHLHHSIGKCENDDTYTRSAANWDHGKAVFNRRKRENFPL